MEHRVEPGDEHRGQQHRKGQRHHEADHHRQQQHAPADLVDLFPGGSLADALAHDHRRRAGDAVAGHGGELLDIAHNGIGRQHLLGDGHVADDGGDQRGAQAPQGVVHQHRCGVFQKIPHKGGPRMEEGGGQQGDPAVPQGVAEGDGELHRPGGQGSQGRAGDPQGRCAELSEDQNIVQKGVQHHGDGEHGEAHGGILRTALDPHIDGAGGVENVAEAHNPQVRSPQLNQKGVVRHQRHDLPGGQEQRQGDESRQGHTGVKGNTHTAVDGLRVMLAPVLAHQHRQSAEEAEDDDLHQKDGCVGGGDGGDRPWSE